MSMTFVRRLGTTLLASCLLIGSGCTQPVSNTTGAAPSGRLRIVCTTGMVADIVQQVAGDRADVIPLFGAVDPHTYEPTAKDVERIQSADIVFYSGLFLEGPTQETLERATARGRKVFAITDCLTEEAGYIRYPGGSTAHPDPHVWMDVAAWNRCTRFVADTLTAQDPTGRDVYIHNAEEYQKSLRDLDAYARTAIATIPKEQRHLVTAHDAFEYFSRAYDIPVRSVQGISTESEAGTDDINQLVDFLVTNHVPAVFVESTVNQANLLAVIEGAAQRNWKVTVAGELYSDAMGPPGTYTGTYIGMLDHNVTRITRALGGTAPERGLNGKLTQ
jgi:manganese/zinc/iron transport system substrate-binding protein